MFLVVGSTDLVQVNRWFLVKLENGCSIGFSKPIGSYNHLHPRKLRDGRPKSGLGKGVSFSNMVLFNGILGYPCWISVPLGDNDSEVARRASPTRFTGRFRVWLMFAKLQVECVLPDFLLRMVGLVSQGSVCLFFLINEMHILTPAHAMYIRFKWWRKRHICIFDMSSMDVHVKVHTALTNWFTVRKPDTWLFEIRSLLYKIKLWKNQKGRCFL